MTHDAGEIEELVRAAAQDADPAARRRLFGALRAIEVFFPLKVKQFEGAEVNATPLLRLSDGTNAMMLYTSKADPNLTDKFCGGSFEAALTAALKMPDLDWVILSNRDAQWVSIGKQQIPAVLAGMTPTAEPGATAGELITRAADSAPAEASAAVDSALAGSELYLELSAAAAEDGRPAMKTFRVGQLPRVIHAYLTRRRPGIAYGGIGWEALKQMVSDEPAIDGVQVINDADDWVVFDRAALSSGPDTP